MNATSDSSVQLLSAAGPGAIAVLRLRGRDALARLAALVPRELPAPGALGLVHLNARGEPLDEAVCVRRGPEDCELHLHGSPALVARVLAELEPAREPRAPSRAEAAAESREPFASSSFEVRALERLPSAPCEAAARMLLDQARGALRRELARALHVDPPRWRACVDRWLERARVAEHLLRPWRVVLRGPANAGKSTLFNALLGHERALTSAQAGTTRDALVAEALLGPWPMQWVDTAGEREAEADARASELEQAALARARREEGAADWILWCSADPRAAAPQSARATRVTTRADELAPELAREAALPIAALREPEAACARLRRAYELRFALPQQPWEPGAGVPCERALCTALAEARAFASPSARQLALRAALGAAPSVDAAFGIG